MVLFVLPAAVRGRTGVWEKRSGGGVCEVREERTERDTQGVGTGTDWEKPLQKGDGSLE